MCFTLSIFRSQKNLYRRISKWLICTESGFRRILQAFLPLCRMKQVFRLSSVQHLQTWHQTRQEQQTNYSFAIPSRKQRQQLVIQTIMRHIHCVRLWMLSSRRLELAQSLSVMFWILLFTKHHIRKLSPLLTVRRFQRKKEFFSTALRLEHWSLEPTIRYRSMMKDTLFSPYLRAERIRSMLLVARSTHLRLQNRA